MLDDDDDAEDDQPEPPRLREGLGKRSNDGAVKSEYGPSSKLIPSNSGTDVPISDVSPFVFRDVVWSYSLLKDRLPSGAWPHVHPLIIRSNPSSTNSVQQQLVFTSYIRCAPLKPSNIVRRRSGPKQKSSTW
jgi:hypothetical protein